MAKTGPKRKFNPNPEELKKLYQKMSMNKIAQYYGVGETVVFTRIKEHGIVLEGMENGGHRKAKRTFTEEHRRNMSKALMGKFIGSKGNNWKGGDVTKICTWCGEQFQVRNGSNAKFCSNKCRGLNRTNLLGEKNYNWKGGKTQYRRNTKVLKEWKRLSLERANGVCEECGVTGNRVCECCNQKVDLHVHHVKSWKDHPDFRYDLSNAKVLCTSCHRNAHSPPGK